MTSWEVMKDLLSDVELADFANYASIVSFFLTAAVFVAVRTIKKFYLFVARVPDLSVRLSEQASNISAQLNAGIPSVTKVREILADAEVTVESLIKKTQGTVRKDAIGLSRKIKKIGDGPNWWARLTNNDRSALEDGELLEESLREIYILMYKLHSSCREAYEDSRWEN